MPLDDFDYVSEEEYESDSEEIKENESESDSDVGSKENEVNEYLFLVDLVSSLNQLSLSIQVVESMFNVENLPVNLKNIFNLFVEKDQFLSSLSIANEKLDMIKAAAEGALLATAALEFTQKLAESALEEQ